MSDGARPRFRWAAAWGAVGFAALLVQAVVRLTPLALEPVRRGMSAGQWALFALSIAFNGVFEGYSAFHRRVAPRVVARALYLGEHPRPLRVALAPLFATGLFGASRRRMRAAWLLYLGLAILIIGVHQLGQPWRGIVDAGVVVGLSWGALAIVVVYARALGGRPPAVDLELPEGEEP
jgi:hypothetical protein